MSTKLPNKDYLLAGVIADTHGVLLPAAVKALKDTDLIIHAGDIDNTEVLDELQSIAPVVAVRGNMDMAGDVRDLPETEAVEIGDVLLYVLHDVHRLDIDPSKAGFDAVIFGHLHLPSITKDNGILFLNPGSASQPRHNYPASIALITIRGNAIKARIVDLES